MGGTCSRLVSVKTSKAFKNRVHTLPLPQDESEKVEGNLIKSVVDEDTIDKNQDRVTTEESTIEVESPDIFSKGDHKDCSKVIEVNINRIEQYAPIQNILERGDYKIEDMSYSHNYNNVIEIGNSPKRHGTSPSSGEEQNLASLEDDNSDADRSHDSNDNSYNGHPREPQVTYNIVIDSTCDESGDNINVPLTPRDAVRRIENQVEEKRDGSENVDSIPQDSLFFLPLDGDQSHPTASYKIPERLNRSRKPPLSYSERMLLADCNRFQQLDKKREFAVRRNRSISRIGKLPKIVGESNENNSKASKTLNKPDH